eukprot:NODE_190_length_13461_cov_0.525595.p14 type:complete len:100 gc:universal NODE_190_length_13461_cov_0.525595:10758-11057(+)
MFINPEIRTQMIESRWHDLRLHLPQYGVDFDNIESYLYDFMFRKYLSIKRSTKAKSEDYKSFINGIVAAYPPGPLDAAIANGQNFELFEHFYLLKGTLD